ncbi:MAG: alpha/beta fold hydrolase [Bacteroidota bacterium]
MKWIKRLLYFFGGGYLLLCGFLFFAQDALIFHPTALSPEHKYGNHEEEWIELSDGVRLNALRLRSSPSKGIILYLHGNVGSNGRSLYQTRAIADLGYDLFLVDYRGFGKSTGEIKEEEAMTNDLQVVYDRLKQDYAEEDIIVLGYSLGSGPASYLAAKNSPKAAVLVAPYRSLLAMKNEFFWMFPDWLMKYRLDNATHLAQASCPVVLLHGTADELIPFSMSTELATLDPGRIKLVKLPNVSHRGAIMNPRVAAEVRKLVE